jgi:CRISPR system Cascade subunit CasB
VDTLATKEQPFITYLLSKADDRAMLAALRRGLGAAPGDPETAEMSRYVEHRIRKDATEREDRDIYMIASLFALHPTPTAKGNLGDHLRRLTFDESRADATERRFVQLLRMRRETLEPRLRQQISILKSKDIAVNWHQLFADLRNWDHPKRFVQRNWARSYWRAAKSESKSA